MDQISKQHLPPDAVDALYAAGAKREFITFPSEESKPKNATVLFYATSERAPAGIDMRFCLYAVMIIRNGDTCSVRIRIPEACSHGEYFENVSANDLATLFQDKREQLEAAFAPFQPQKSDR